MPFYDYNKLCYDYNKSCYKEYNVNRYCSLENVYEFIGRGEIFCRKKANLYTQVKFSCYFCTVIM